MDQAAGNLRRALAADPGHDDSRKVRVRWMLQPAQMRAELLHSQPQESQAIGHVMNGRNDNFAGKGLADAVRRAREKGMTWESISVVLGLPINDVLQRFRYIADDELTPVIVQQPVVRQQEPQPLEEDAPVKPDFSALQAMSIEELTALGTAASAQISSSRRNRPEYDIALREAIVVTLYQREVPTSAIAAAINRSSQRISQIVNGYYRRIEAEWEAQRNA
jgi:hypothetical protein